LAVRRNKRNNKRRRERRGGGIGRKNPCKNLSAIIEIQGIQETGAKGGGKRGGGSLTPTKLGWIRGEMGKEKEGRMENGWQA